MPTTPPERRLHDPTDPATSAHDAHEPDSPRSGNPDTPEPEPLPHPPDPGQALETVSHLLVRAEAMVWATGQALGLSYAERDRGRSEGRLHALVGIAGEVAEAALDETEGILESVFGYTRSLDPGRE